MSASEAMPAAATSAAASTKSFRVSRSTTSFAPIGSGASSGIGAGAGAGAGAGIGVVGLASSSQPAWTSASSATAKAIPGNRVTGEEGIRFCIDPMLAPGVPASRPTAPIAPLAWSAGFSRHRAAPWAPGWGFPEPANQLGMRSEKTCEFRNELPEKLRIPEARSTMASP